MALEFVSGFIVSSLLQELVDKIKASAADTIGLAYHSDVEDELKQLEATYVKIQSMLDNVDGRDLISSNWHQKWVADIRRACYETEDFTEGLNLEILEKGDAGFPWSYWTKWGLSSKIRELQRNLLHLINPPYHFFVKTPGFCDARHLGVDKEPMIVPDDESFQRKQDKESIIRLLLQSSSSSVVLIAGMFGVGKTALAQVVKNDSSIQSHFDHRLWVPVSGDFNLMKVLCSMILDLQLEQIKEARSIYSPPFPEQQYTRLFMGLCKERRILIVLDDLCNFVKPQDWEDFQSLLLDPSCVFAVLITTRNPRVSSIVASLSRSTTASYYLQQMSDEDCGLILQKKADIAAVNKRTRCGKNMSAVVAVQIAEKFCKGLPLVANMIGNRLSLKQEHSLSTMLQKDLWCMPEFREQIFPAFRLNYSDLSFFLKNCFPYFSLFPKEYVYRKDDLARLWLAEGYIKPQFSGFQYSDCSEYAILEELANHYFDDVLSQSILQIYHPFDQEAHVYKMHEFVHRYSQFIGSDMYIQLDEQFVGAFSSSTSQMLNSADITTRYRNCRHLSLLCPSIARPLWKDIERHSEGLRTILSLSEHISVGQVSYTLFLKLQSLRVLNLSGTDISELPESLGKLKHLRLLDVSKTDIQEFPASITDLHMLQFLKADQCPLLLQLPKKTRKLFHLLHLRLTSRV
ncbi:putative disease resistance protein RGA3 [Beta vulgaris subsp. vulgaris]|uniref:putative disease resistance protein RGA3 n=1 Tax=Beta vulgaris subsp. vulgaris TaxID=3555 RepID=UPI0025490D05|nr:putative disease resistance protein RGA3 [Beta vulgaris subsp. vulgaris]